MKREEWGYFVLANEYLDFLCFLEDRMSVNEYNNLREEFFNSQ